MLAQSQVCFVQVARMKNMKTSTQCKLIAGAAEFYNKAIQQTKSSQLKRLDKTWTNYMLYHEAFHNASAYHLHGQIEEKIAEEEHEGYGMLCAIFDLAKQHITDAVNFAKVSELKEETRKAEEMKKEIEESLARVVKWNQKVFKEKIPSMEKVPTLKTALMAKLQPFTPPILEKKDDIFSDLVPQAVQNAVERFDTKRLNFIKNLNRYVQREEKEIREQLDSLGLPGKVEAEIDATGAGIPEKVWQRVEKTLQTRCGHFSGLNNAPKLQLEKVRSETAVKQKKVMDILNSAANMLSKEEREDSTSRQSYGKAWRRPPSHELNKRLEKDIDTYSDLLRTAKQSNENVITPRWVSSQESIELLGRPKKDLDNMMPAPSSVIKEQDTKEVIRLRQELLDILVELGLLIRQRDSLRTEAERKARDVNITESLLNAGVGDMGKDGSTTMEKENFILSEWMGKFAQDQVKIEKISSECRSILENNVLKLNAAFNRARSVDDYTQSREVVLNRLNKAVNDFEDLYAMLIEEQNFFSELETKSHRLMQTVKDHCHSRELEKNEMLLNIGVEMQKLEIEEADAQLAQRLHGEEIAQQKLAESQSMRDQALAKHLSSQEKGTFLLGNDDEKSGQSSSSGSESGSSTSSNEKTASPSSSKSFLSRFFSGGSTGSSSKAKETKESKVYQAQPVDTSPSKPTNTLSAPAPPTPPSYDAIFNSGRSQHSSSRGSSGTALGNASMFSSRGSGEDTNVRRLMDMGFTSVQAQNALAASDGDLQQATLLLLSEQKS